MCFLLLYTCVFLLVSENLALTKNILITRTRQQDLMNLLGALYAAVLFLGATNASTVQDVVVIERTVFYRERAAGMYSELPYAFAQVQIFISVKELDWFSVFFLIVLRLTIEC